MEEFVENKTCCNGKEMPHKTSSEALVESRACTPSCACGQFNTANCYIGRKYIEHKYACDINEMIEANPQGMEAQTSNQWGKKMECDNTPGSNSRGCCYWGRGAIQLTGLTNYGIANKRIATNADKLSLLVSSQTYAGIPIISVPTPSICGLELSPTGWRAFKVIPSQPTQGRRQVIRTQDSEPHISNNFASSYSLDVHLMIGGTIPT